LKAFRKFPRHRKIGNNEVGQNDFISEILGIVKILLCFTINPDVQTPKLTTAKGEGKPSYLTSKDCYPKTYHSSDESSDGSSSSLTSVS
jgi:hypothetical protein